MTESEREVQRTLGRIEEKLDMVLPRLNNHSDRIGSLERGRAWLLGAAAATGLLVSIVFTLLKA